MIIRSVVHPLIVNSPKNICLLIIHTFLFVCALVVDDSVCVSHKNVSIENWEKAEKRF